MPKPNYASEWFEYGLKEDDSIIKFMMHWIAFNWLYSECRREQERSNIKMFCYQNYDRLSAYDAFSSDAFQVFKEAPVRDETSGRTDRSLYISMLEDRGEKRLVSLFLTLYQVRCNLFHGSKSLHVKRDIELVRAASVILEGYMNALLSEI